jgi:hypothetical protein
MPGIAKTRSTTKLPVSTDAAAGPRYESAGRQPPFADAGGARRPHEVVRESVAHPRADEARDDGGDGRTERDGRQDEVRRRAAAGDREDRNRQPEEKQEKRGQHEAGKRDAREREDRREEGDGASRARGGEDAGRPAERHREGEGQRPELERNGERLREQPVHRAVRVSRRGPEVEPRDDRADVPQVLARERLVEVIRLADACLHGGRQRPLAVEGAAGNGADQEEARAQDEERGDREEREAARAEGEHTRTPTPAYS